MPPSRPQALTLLVAIILCATLRGNLRAFKVAQEGNIAKGRFRHMTTNTLGQHALGKRSSFRPAAKVQITRSGLVLFAINFFKHPRLLGTIFPSSRFLVDRVLSRIAWDQCRVIVEYGPGVGQITAEILRRMHPDATLIGIELNADFVRYLRGAMSDSRLRLVSSSAAQVRTVLRQLGHTSADCIIAGIPFSTLGRLERRAILSETDAALADDGQLTIYQYSGALQADLERVFAQVECERTFLNFVPAQLFHCVKRPTK